MSAAAGGGSTSDVLVVGGGVIGCAVAWYAAREGLSVTLLERGELAGEASGAAAGMLLPFGEADEDGPFLHWALKSLRQFPELCAELRERSGIDPEFEASGVLHVATSDEAARDLRERVQRFAAHHLEWLDAPAARAEEPRLGAALHGAVHSPDEAHVRSGLLTRAYAGAAAQLGARIELGAAVKRLLREGARVSGVETNAGPRHAGCVVLCAGAWTPGLAPFRLPVKPVRGQIASLENLHPPLRRILVAGDVYLVPKRDGSLVVGATEEQAGFDSRVTAGGMARLLAAATGLVPDLADARLRDGWAGLRPASPDRLPAIGAAPGCEGLIVAAGHFRNGVLLSPITGRLVADLLLGKAAPEPARAFRPDRFGGRRSAQST